MHNVPRCALPDFLRSVETVSIPSCSCRHKSRHRRTHTSPSLHIQSLHQTRAAGKLRYYQCEQRRKLQAGDSPSFMIAFTYTRGADFTSHTIANIKDTFDHYDKEKMTLTGQVACRKCLSVSALLLVCQCFSKSGL